MHLKTQQKKQALKTHRHLVILPLFVFAVAFSLFFAKGQKPPPPPADHEESTLSLPGGVTGFLSPGAQAEFTETIFSLLYGSILLQGDGTITVQSEDTLFHGLSGTFFLSRQGGVISAAAISSPILIEKGSTQTLVPVGLQWREDSAHALSSSVIDRMRSLTPVPPSFLKEKLIFIQNHLGQAGENVQDSSSTLVDTVKRWGARFHLSGSIFSFDAARFPNARLESLEKKGESLLLLLSNAIHNEDLGDVERLLRDKKHKDVIAHSSFPAQLSSLLYLSKDHPGILSQLLSLYTRSERAWLLSSIHPLYRERAWLLPPPSSVSHEAETLRLISFVPADLLPHAQNPVISKRWAKTLSATLMQEEDPQAFLTSFLPILKEAAMRMQRLDYPERLKRYADLTTDITQRYTHALPDQSRSILQSIVDLADTPLHLFASKEASSTLTAVVVEELDTSFDESAVENEGFILLQSLNALTTIQTIVNALSATEVRIRSAVFPGSMGDRVLDFTYNIETNLITDVTEGATTYPYPVTPERFKDWVSG